MTRVLHVLVGATGIEDGQIAPPVVGEVARYELTFIERAATEPDATVSTLHARAHPRDAAAPRQGRHWDGTPNPLPPSWPTVLRGNGWSAGWSAPRPVLGEVVVRGVLVADLLTGGADGPARGRLTRAQLVTETHVRTGSGSQDWRRDPTAQRLTDVETGPRWFDRGMVPDPDNPTTGWGRMVHTDPWVRETGVLVDLDLDDAPPRTPRPAIVPGAVAVHGDDVWVVDEQLPLLVRLRDEQVVEVHTWPGGIVPGRRVLADPGGAWITGADGTLRVSLGGGVRAVSDEPSWLATSSGETLAVQVVLEPHDVHSTTVLRLREPGCAPQDVDLGGRHLAGVAMVPDGFLLLVTPPDDHVRRCSLARLGLDGTVVVGPEVADDAYACSLTGGRSPVLARVRGVHPVLGDLTLGAAVPWPGLLGVRGSGDRTWTLHHPQTRVSPQRWPRDWPAQHDHQHWALTELDPSTLEARGSTPVPGIVRDVGVTGDGTVWTIAAGLRRCPGDGSPAELVDVAALLDGSGHLPRWGWSQD